MTGKEGHETKTGHQETASFHMVDPVGCVAERAACDTAKQDASSTETSVGCVETAKGKADETPILISKRSLLWVALAIPLVVAVVVIISLWATGVIASSIAEDKSSSQNPPEFILVPSLPDSNPGVSSHAGYLRSLLPPATTERMKDRQSPQFLAFQWMSYNPSLANFTSDRLLQRYAIWTLFYSLGGWTGTGPKGFWEKGAHEDDECSWMPWIPDTLAIPDDHERASSLVQRGGTACNAQGHLVTLGWIGPLAAAPSDALQSLNGSLPEEIFTLLPSLQTILLPGNPGLTGPLPSQIGLLANLEGLYLDHCQLTGSLPTELGLLTNLKELWINDNAFTGSTLPIKALRDTLVQWDFTNNSFTISVTNDTGSQMAEQNMTGLY